MTRTLGFIALGLLFIVAVGRAIYVWVFNRSHKAPWGGEGE